MSIQKDINDFASKKFAKKLKEIRLRKGISVAELAESSSISRTYITDLENERGYIISKEKMENLIKALEPISQKDKEEFFLYYLEKVVPKEILETMIRKKKNGE